MTPSPFIFALAFCGFFISACTPSEGVDEGPPVGVPVEQSYWFVSRGFEFQATYDQQKDEYHLTVDGEEVGTLEYKEVFDHIRADGVDFYAYRDSYNSTGFYGQSTSGEAYGFLFGSEIFAMNGSDFLVVKTNVADHGDIPTSGGAEYLGGYIGLVAENGQAIEGYIRGEAQLSANFESAEISGSIFERQSFDLHGDLVTTDIAPIQLKSTALESNGYFHGDTQGGEFIGNRIATAGDVLIGNYAGHVGGTDTGEISGNIFLEHEYYTSGGRTYSQEMGAFISN